MDAARNSAVSEKIRAYDSAPALEGRSILPPYFSGYQPLVTVTLAASSGIIFDRYFPAPPSFGVGCLLAAGFLTVWSYAWRKGRDAIAVWPLLAAVAITGAAWHYAQWRL